MSVETPRRRYCVVTPYYKEERPLLERCFASVQRQSPAVDHIVVADGFPQDWVDELPVRHIRLDRAHGDFGNAARGVGALLAIAEAYDGIAFLDADNWYDDDHLMSCLAAAEAQSDAAYVVAQRRFCRPDATAFVGTPADVPYADHVDTNCYLFLPASFVFLHRWCTIPKQLSAYGDQLFGKILRAADLPWALVPTRTVNYLCLTETIYLQRGETPPPGCKPTIRWRDAQSWIYTLPPAGRLHMERMVGLTVGQMDPQATESPSAFPSAPPLLDVEVPGSSGAARLRRTPEDLTAYSRIFIGQLYASADLPQDVGLIVDAAAGIGLAALSLHMRYPNATLIAVEFDREAFEILSGNLAGRNGCEALHASLTPLGEIGDAAPLPTLTDLLTRLDGRCIDLLRLGPEQWQEALASPPSWFSRVRTVLVETRDGVQRIDMTATGASPFDESENPAGQRASSLAAA